jgi:hypothetical protein
MTDIDLNDELEKLLKTFTLTEMAKKRGYKVVDIPLAQYEDVDLSGFPIALSADPCLRVVTQFMEGVDATTTTP